MSEVLGTCAVEALVHAGTSAASVGTFAIQGAEQVGHSSYVCEEILLRPMTKRVELLRHCSSLPKESPGHMSRPGASLRLGCMHERRPGLMYGGGARSCWNVHRIS